MTTPDPYRALDGVEAPDRWDDVVARSERPTPLPVDEDRHPRLRRPLLAAAAVLVVAGLGTAVVVADRDGGDGPAEQVSAGPPTTDGPATGVTEPRVVGSAEAGMFWGNAWTIDTLVDDGVPLVLAAPMDGRPLVLTADDQALGDVRTEAEGVISVPGCNGAGGPAHLVDGILVADSGSWDGDGNPIDDGGWASTEMGCVTSGTGGDLMAQDEFLMTFLQAGPTVTIDGDRLTLVQGDDRLTATLVGRVEPTDDGTLDGPVPGGKDEPTAPTTEAPGTTAPLTVVPDTVPAPSAPSTPPTTEPSPPPTTEPPAPLVADDFFGSTWDIVAVTEDGAERTFSQDPDLVASLDRRATVTNGCNGAGGAVRRDGDRLVPDGEWVYTAMGCRGPGGDDKMAQDDWFHQFLQAGPTLTISGDTATLATASATVDLVRR